MGMGIGRKIMRQMVASIGSYSKKILRQLGLCRDESSLQNAAWQAGGPLRVERRREERCPKISSCTYGLMRSVDRDGVTLEEGRGTAVNESPTGLRLLLGIAPHQGAALGGANQSFRV